MPRRTAAAAFKLGLLALSALLVVRVVVAADARKVADIFAASGATALAALVPYFFAISVDTLGWSALLSSLGHRLGFARLLNIRLSTEAVLLSAPLGTVTAEGLK